MFCVVQNKRKTSNIKYPWFMHILVYICSYSFILSFVSLFSSRCSKFFLSSYRLFFCPPSPLHFFDLFANLFHSLPPSSVISPLPVSPFFALLYVIIFTSFLSSPCLSFLPIICFYLLSPHQFITSLLQCDLMTWQLLACVCSFLPF